MGGDIRVESQVDEGSRFRFDLALSCVEEATAEKRTHGSRPSVPTADCTVPQQAELLLPQWPDRIVIHEAARLGDMFQFEIEAKRC